MLLGVWEYVPVHDRATRLILMYLYIYIIDGDPEITTPWLLPNMPIKTHTKLTCQNDYHEIHTLTAGKRWPRTVALLLLWLFCYKTQRFFNIFLLL